jgi:hypothetical protein
MVLCVSGNVLILSSMRVLWNNVKEPTYCSQRKNGQGFRFRPTRLLNRCPRQRACLPCSHQFPLHTSHAVQAMRGARHVVLDHSPKPCENSQFFIVILSHAGGCDSGQGLSLDHELIDDVNAWLVITLHFTDHCPLAVSWQRILT